MVNGTVSLAKFIFTSRGISALLFALRSARWRCKRAISEPHVVLVWLFSIPFPSIFCPSFRLIQRPPRVAERWLQ